MRDPELSVALKWRETDKPPPEWAVAMAVASRRDWFWRPVKRRVATKPPRRSGSANRSSRLPLSANEQAGAGT